MSTATSKDLTDREKEVVPSWEETFMNLAEVISRRSKDPRTKVGACIVSSDKRILSLGYNGATNLLDDKEIPWTVRNTDEDNKYLYVVHAERNAVLNYRGNFRDFAGASIFVTFSPCLECSKEIAQTGIRKVIYREEYPLDELSRRAKEKIFEAAGVEEVVFESFL